MRYQLEMRQETITAQTITRLSPLPHIHHHLELIYLTEGSGIATVNGKDFLLEAGSFIFLFPNQIHYYHAQSPVTGYLLIFASEMFKDLKELFHTKTPACPIIKAPSSPFDTVKKLETIIKKNNSELSFDKITAKGYLLALLGELFSQITLIDAVANYDNIKNVLIYCFENYTEPLTLDLISQKLYLNKYYISHMFNDQLHISFTKFVTALRIEHACSLLEKNVNISNIALTSGFSSVCTFNRAFLKHVGMTPREFIKRKYE